MPSWGNATTSTVSGSALRDVLTGGANHAHGPELAGRCVRVLHELEMIVLEARGHERRLSVVSSEHTQLERSGAFCAYSARLEEGKRYLASLRQP